MKDTDIRKYAALMKELDLTGLEIIDENNKVRIERCATVQTSERVQVVSTGGYQDKEVDDGDYISVRSTIVGIFYTAPAENAEPYVKIGDSVKKGQALCIVEAMKLMNEITAEEEGVISQICAANGQMVEYGTELFRIKR